MQMSFVIYKNDLHKVHIGEFYSDCSSGSKRGKKFNFFLLPKSSRDVPVQWVRLCTPNAGGQVRSPVRDLDPT